MSPPVSISKPMHRHVVSSVSTNSELIDAIKNGEIDTHAPYLLTAESQTAGRGQRERSWQSPRGNIYLSLYHPVQVPVSGLLSLVIGVELAKMSVIQSLNKQLHAQGLPVIGVKWANDLGFYTPPSQYKNSAEINDSDLNINYFNKLAGILIEPVWQSGKLVGVVMGVGLNVDATPALTTQTSEGMSYQAISLQDMMVQLKPETNPESTVSMLSVPSLQDLYHQVSRALIDAMASFAQLAAERSTTQTPYTDEFLRQFDAMDALTTLRLQVTQDHNGESHILTGHACGIDTNGCLQLRQDSGKISALFTGRIDVVFDV